MPVGRNADALGRLELGMHVLGGCGVGVGLALVELKNGRVKGAKVFVIDLK